MLFLTLEKIIYIADFIEPNRNILPDMDIIRKEAYTDLDVKLDIKLNMDKNEFEQRRSIYCCRCGYLIILGYDYIDYIERK